MHVNNEIGAVQPIKEAAQIIHRTCQAMFHVDAIQSFGKLPVFFDGDNGPDVISISGHKIQGLKGSGLLAFRKKPQLKAFIVGGGQEFGLRSGTVAVPQAVSLAKAARLTVEGMPENFENFQKMVCRFSIISLSNLVRKYMSFRQKMAHRIFYLLVFEDLKVKF